MERPTHPPVTAAAVMRSIGQRRLLPPVPRSFLCAPCAVAWIGDETDCWNCGKPASTEYARSDAAARVLRVCVIPRLRGAVLGREDVAGVRGAAA